MQILLTIEDVERAVRKLFLDAGFDLSKNLGPITIVWKDHMVGSQIQKRAVWQDALFDGIEIEFH